MKKCDGKRIYDFGKFLRCVIGLGFVLLLIGMNKGDIAKAQTFSAELVYKDYDGTYSPVNTLGNTTYADVSRDKDFCLNFELDSELIEGSRMTVYVEQNGKYQSQTFTCSSHSPGFSHYVRIASMLNDMKGQVRIYYDMTLANGQELKHAELDTTNAFYVNLLGEYTVAYDSNGGSGAPASQSKYSDCDLVLSSTKPTRSGYAFAGWADSKFASEADYQPGDSYAENGNITLYAVWKTVTKSYVYYDANGGSGAPYRQIKYSDSDLTLSTQIPVLEGYVFKGWDTSRYSAEASYQPGESYTKDGNVTLYAVWEKVVTYDVCYNANGGSGTPSKQTKYEDKILILSAQKPYRTGYTFKGWGTSKYDSEASYQPGDVYYVNDDITLYAVWEITKYNVLYDANGGNSAPAAQVKNNNKTLILSSLQPVRAGYTFEGWATTSTASTAQYLPGGSYTRNSNVTLYAVWKLNKYNIYYNANGGTGEPQKQIQNGDSFVTLSTVQPVRKGYTFRGWARSSSAKIPLYQPGDVFNTDKSLTLYAVWEKKPVSTTGSAKPKRRPQKITAKSKTIVKGAEPVSLGASSSGGGKLSYSSSNTGVAKINSAGVVTPKGYGITTITIKAPSNKFYEGAVKKILVTVVPKKMVLTSVSSKEKGQLSSSWKKDNTVTGYQIQCSLTKKFTKGTLQADYDKSKPNMTTAGFPRNKTYYVRIRSYIRNKGKNCYGQWSNVKGVKIK